MKSRISQSAFQKALYLEGKEFADSIAKHAEIYDRGLAGLTRAVASGRRRQIRTHQSRLLTSYSSKLVCLVRVLKKKDGFSLEDIYKVAAALDTRSDCGEVIRCWGEEKSSGHGWRPICSFGPKRAALQLLASDVLEARFGINQMNFLSRNKGAERASDWIVQKADEEEFSLFVLADIKDFYPSVRKEKVSEVTGLPTRVVENTILIRNDTYLSSGGFPPYIDFETFVGAVLQGLPQGSRTSQTASSILLASVLKQISSAERAIFHGDDCAFAATSLKEAKAFEKALEGTLASHPAGPFRLKHCNVEHINVGFDFLQYRIKRHPWTQKTMRRPAARSYGKYKKKIEEYFAEVTWQDELHRTERRREAVRNTARYRSRWMRAFRRWTVNPNAKLALWQLTFDTIYNGFEAKSLRAANRLLVWDMTSSLQFDPDASK